MGGHYRKLVVFPVVVLWLGASVVASVLPNEVPPVLMRSGIVRSIGIALLKTTDFSQISFSNDADSMEIV